MIKHQWKKAGKVLLTSILSLTLLASSYFVVRGRVEAEEVSDGAALHNSEVVMDEYDTVYFGRYWQEDTNGDGVADQNDEMTPIRWRILSRDGDDAYVIADQVLDAKPYNEENTDVTWATCTLRTWLNEDFYNNAFTVQEQDAVIGQTLINEDNEIYGTKGGKDTMDKVYLPSISDMKNTDYGFPSEEVIYGQAVTARIGTATDYAKSQGADVNSQMVCWWWLRSPGNYADYASNVIDYGHVITFGCNVSVALGGVRPALHISLSSSLDKTETMTADETEIKYSEEQDDTTTRENNEIQKKDPYRRAGVIVIIIICFVAGIAAVIRWRKIKTK